MSSMRAADCQMVSEASARPAITAAISAISTAATPRWFRHRRERTFIRLLREFDGAGDRHGVEAHRRAVDADRGVAGPLDGAGDHLGAAVLAGEIAQVVELLRGEVDHARHVRTG